MAAESGRMSWAGGSGSKANVLDKKAEIVT